MPDAVTAGLTGAPAVTDGDAPRHDTRWEWSPVEAGASQATQAELPASADTHGHAHTPGATHAHATARRGCQKRRPSAIGPVHV